MEENKKDSKKLWKILNTVIKGTKDQANFKLRDIENDLDILPENVPNFINDYFLNIGPTLASGYEDEWSYDGMEEQEGIGDISTNVEEVIKYVNEIDINKSSAIDGIAARALKDCLLAIPEKVSELFNESFRSSVIPQAWKVGTVVPLQKDGNKADVANLRPVTLLPVIGKILEKIVNKRLMDYLETNELLDPFQGGFRPDHSTISTVAYFTDDIYRGINMREFTLSIFVDLKKAFDTVNHSILLKKLSKLGVGGLLHRWLTDYLKDRKQKTFANGLTSDEGNVLCGVPQGSILGPTLFLVYINDLRNVIMDSKTFLYADDTVVSVTGNNLNHMTDLLEGDLRRLDIWFRKNKLTLNAKKTNYMIFGLRSRLKEVVQHKLRFGDRNIDRCISFKYLGVILDPVLNFNMQAESAYKKIVYRVHQMAVLRDSMGNDTMLNMYKTMVLPHADYGDIFYGVARKAILEKMQIVENKALRMCKGLEYRYPVIPTHQLAKISKLEPRRKMHLVNFMYKQQSNSDLINNRNVFTRAHDATLFLCIKPKNESSKKSALYRGAVAWNNLPVYVRNIDDYEKFKLNRKKWLGSTNYP